MDNGASKFVLKTYDINDLYDAINSDFRNWLSLSNNMERLVSEIIYQLGIPAHIKGYYYLRKAILCSIEDKTILNSVKKRLYPTVADIYDTTSFRVERYSPEQNTEISDKKPNQDNFFDIYHYKI